MAMSSEGMYAPEEGLAATQENASKAPPNLTTLPTEILTSTIACLEKPDLKILRLVHSRFDEIAHPFLFNKAVISSNLEDLEVFRSIINDPRLAKHVTMMVFVVSSFRYYQFEYYVKELAGQLEQDLKIRKANVDVASIPETLRKHMEEVNWYKDPGSTRNREKLVALFQPHLIKGFDLYRETRRKRAYATWCWRNWQFLLESFQKCPKLQAVEVQTVWQHYDQPINDNVESLLPTYSSSGYVARNWHPLYLRPVSPVQDGMIWDSLLTELLFALDKSKKQVSYLRIGSGCTVPEPGMRNEKRTLLYHNTMDVFRHLTVLSFETSLVFLPSSYYLVCWLRPALRVALSLRRLRLVCTNTTQYNHLNTLRYDFMPLCKGVVLPRLITLDLVGMLVSVEEFIGFLQNQKALTTLNIQMFDVKKESATDDKDWLRLVEGLHSLKLTHFTIGGPLRFHCKWRVWKSICPIDDDETQWAKLKADIERRVLFGGDFDPIGGLLNW